jgi:ribonuclease Z
MDHHPNVKDHDVRRVFLTHLHGDHMFGLPGLMSRINLHEKEALEKHKFIGQEEPFEIIGPHGVGRFVRTAISISKTRLKYKWRIVELRHGEPAKGSPDDVDLNTTLLDNEMPMEIVHPDSSILDLEKRYVWRLPGKDLDETGSVKDFDVTACEIKHTKSMPSIGYVLQEPTLPRNLVIEKVRHHLELNRDWIEETYGKERARKMKEAIKSPNFRLELPSGVVMDASDPDSEFFGPIRRGRKICVLGDTRDAGNISSEAHGADLLVHECTYLDHQNKNAKMRGHSTPSMAGAFAKSIEAKRLVLNHAGSIIAPYNKKLCQSVVSSAQRAMGAKKNSVWLSSDDDVYSLPVPKD